MPIIIRMVIARCPSLCLFLFGWVWQDAYHEAYYYAVSLWQDAYHYAN